MSAETHGTIDAVWRIESPRLIAGLARMVRDVGLEEVRSRQADGLAGLDLVALRGVR